MVKLWTFINLATLCGLIAYSWINRDKDSGEESSFQLDAPAQYARCLDHCCIAVFLHAHRINDQSAYELGLPAYHTGLQACDYLRSV